MIAKFFSTLLIIAIVSTSSLSFAKSTPTEEEIMKSQRNINQMQAVNSEYERQRKSANNLLIGGGITTGIGAATMVTGLVIAGTATKKKNPADFTVKFLSGVILTGIGGALTLAGGIITTVGIVKKSKLSDYYVTPTIDPINERYSLNFGMNF